MGAVPAVALASNLDRALPSSQRSLTELLERLRTPAARGLAFALHETTAGARPYLLAGLHRELGGTLLVVVPTADLAERTFADLSYYVGEDEPSTVALFRPRDETVGALASPSERSARMGLLADLSARRPRIVVAPVSALRQYLVPPAAFAARSFEVRVGDEPGFDALQERLYAAGYARVDVVSAAGEYAVRGGILDLFPATADRPMRLEFFGDALESIRAFDIRTQRSDTTVDTLAITPWLEIPRDSDVRARVERAVQGEANVVAAVRTFLAEGHDVPEPWVGLAFPERATILDYFEPRAIVVLEEPGMLATLDESLDGERSRQTEVLLAGVGAGELDVREDAVGEALVAELEAPYPRLATYRDALAARRVLVVTGGIETGGIAWLPTIVEGFALETRPADHFNRQIERFVDAAGSAPAIRCGWSRAASHASRKSSRPRGSPSNAARASLRGPSTSKAGRSRAGSRSPDCGCTSSVRSRSSASRPSASSCARSKKACR
jgi:hypothetical protein